MFDRVLEIPLPYTSGYTIKKHPSRLSFYMYWKLKANRNHQKKKKKIEKFTILDSYCIFLLLSCMNCMNPVNSFSVLFCVLLNTPWEQKLISWNEQNISVVICRSSRPKVFYKKVVLRNFAKFTGKHLRESLYFNKVAGLRSANVCLQGSKRPIFLSYRNL